MPARIRTGLALSRANRAERLCPKATERKNGGNLTSGRMQGQRAPRFNGDTNGPNPMIRKPRPKHYRSDSG